MSSLFKRWGASDSVDIFSLISYLNRSILVLFCLTAVFVNPFRSLPPEYISSGAGGVHLLNLKIKTCFVANTRSSNSPWVVITDGGFINMLSLLRYVNRPKTDFWRRHQKLKTDVIMKLIVNGTHLSKFHII